MKTSRKPTPKQNAKKVGVTLSALDVRDKRSIDYDSLPGLLSAIKIPEEIKRLSTDCATNAGILAALLRFDRLMKDIKAPKVQAKRKLWKKLLAAEFGKVVYSRAHSTILKNSVKVAEAVGFKKVGEGTSAEIAIQGAIAIASLDGLDTFARVFFDCAINRARCDVDCGIRLF